jgi:hypothetical protein
MHSDGVDDLVGEINILMAFAEYEGRAFVWLNDIVIYHPLFYLSLLQNALPFAHCGRRVELDNS